MRILVTGSSGVIGQTLVPMLQEAGHIVIPFDIHDNPSFDICNQMSLRMKFFDSQPDMCIHMAAQVGRYNGEMDADDSVRRNITGTLNVIRMCVRMGVKLINFSTSEVYGHNSVFGSPDILEQNGVYGITKLAAEALVKHFVDNYGLSAITVRPFMVYGPHEVPNGIYRSAISSFIATAMEGGEIAAHEGCVRSWCYVEDFCKALMLIVESPFPSEYKAVQVGTSEYRTMEEAAKIVIDTVGRGTYVVVPPPDGFVSVVKKADFSYITEMGFTPSVQLEEGVKRTVDWMKEVCYGKDALG